MITAGAVLANFG